MSTGIKVARLNIIAGTGRAVDRLGKLELTPRGTCFSLSKRAELALAFRTMMHSLAVAAHKWSSLKAGIMSRAQEAVGGILQVP